MPPGSSLENAEKVEKKMRLIDADALLREIMNEAMQVVISGCDHWGNDVLYSGTGKYNGEVILKKIEAAPTLEVRPKGRRISLVTDKEETKLSFVKIPDNATDYMIIECDGFEYVICVIDGKLKEVLVD